MKKSILIVFVIALLAGYALADEMVIPMNMVNDQGLDKDIGTVTVKDSKFGLILAPQLSNLPQGIHGFHVHQNSDCGSRMVAGHTAAALAAGGHYDPLKTDKHEGPYGSGHLGDLPFLYADKDGNASSPVLAPRLKAADLKGRSLIIHAGGDNYSDSPEKLGGGGGRIACGSVK